MVFARNGMYGDFVAEITELEGIVESTIDAGRSDLCWSGFWEDLGTIGPVGCICQICNESVLSKPLHSNYKCRAYANKVEDS